MCKHPSLHLLELPVVDLIVGIFPLTPPSPLRRTEEGSEVAQNEGMYSALNEDDEWNECIAVAMLVCCNKIKVVRILDIQGLLGRTLFFSKLFNDQAHDDSVVKCPVMIPLSNSPERPTLLLK